MDIAKVVGAASLGVLTSFQEDIEWWLRCSVLIVTLSYTLFKFYQARKYPHPKADEKAD